MVRVIATMTITSPSAKGLVIALTLAPRTPTSRSAIIPAMRPIPAMAIPVLGFQAIRVTPPDRAII